MSKQLTGKAPLTQVRTTSRGIAFVRPGQPVPTDILAEDRTRLLKEGFLVEIEVEEEAESEAPAPGSIPFILAEVGDDPTKAQAALDAEIKERGDKTRKGLVASLEKVIGA